ncbi:MAG: hypothetical protein COB33_004070 [Thiotrichaceae bacterium]|nr:hypothetical protein [Thiotrichaceae bacterium]
MTVTVFFLWLSGMTVLTFDQGGLLGVRISKEILQTELGVDLRQPWHGDAGGW